MRRRVTVTELEADRDERVAQVLSVLARDRLVTVGEGEVEVAHEALLREWPRLRRWLEEDAQGRRLHHHLRDAASAWDAGGRDAGELYRGARLTSALEWWADHEADVNAPERAFLAASRAASERERRRLRTALAGVAALLALSVIAGLVALAQRGNARDEATAADALRLGSRALVEPDLDRALLLARQGVALEDTAQTRGNLLAALLKSPAAIGILRADSERILTAALSPDERILAVGNIPGRVSLFETADAPAHRHARADAQRRGHPRAELQPGRQPPGRGARDRARRPVHGASERDRRDGAGHAHASNRGACWSCRGTNRSPGCGSRPTA